MAEKKVLVSPRGYPIWEGVARMSLEGEGTAMDLRTLRIKKTGRKEWDERGQSGGIGGRIQG